MLHNDIASLATDVQQRYRKFKERCEKANLIVREGETLREHLVQAVYVLRNRLTDDKTPVYPGSKITNQDIAIMALQELSQSLAWRFTEEECKKTVTWTLDSNHEDGHAIDLIVYSKDSKGNLYKNYDFSHHDWIDVLRIAKEEGFILGAEWKNPDYPHIEYRS